ncbi:hypothetical protein Ade02nite_86250 [Paractinoplanes deccanensis]|uniref:Integral membrane protein n=1 Tax=Paractinoplanes deccanensis TaxID=113561 RepID=A0ABQ3YJ12_9ACTN|nr:hypothetical protein [Actinoplanes deccanensis]GID79984.1 hypothetical protein Ade02nite_86250 [Actinoplanes deccanensis]
MRLLTLGRLAAAVLSVLTFVFLFLHDSWHADNLFLVPDLILIAALAVAAALPARHAAAALPIAFAYTTGVLATSVASYAVRSELGLPSLAGALTALGFAVALARPNGTTPTRRAGAAPSRSEGAASTRPAGTASPQPQGTVPTR